MYKEAVEVVNMFSLERINERFVDVAVPQIFEEMVEMERLALQERIDEQLVTD